MANTILQAKKTATTTKKFLIFRMLSIFCLVMGFGVSGVRGQVTLTTTGSPVTIDFSASVSGVCSSNVVSTASSAMMASTPAVGQLDADAWAFVTDVATSGAVASFPGSLTANFATTTNASSNTGWGMSNISSDRELAIFPSGSNATPGSITLLITNNTGATLNELVISYNVRAYNDQDRANKVEFWYSATNAASSYTENTAAEFTSTGTSSSSFESASRTVTLTSLSIANNANYYIRWFFDDVSGSGNRDEFFLDDISVTGNAPSPSIAISNGTITAGNVNNGQTNVVLQRYDLAVTTANATLNGLTVTTAGTYAAADLTNLKVRYSTDATLDGGDATLSTKTTSLGSGSQVFPSFATQVINSGSNGYIFVTADIAGSATNGNTINVASTAFSDISFAAGTKTGTDPVAAGGAQTIVVATPDIALSSPTSSTANFTVGTTNNELYRFDLAITTANTTLTGVTITTAGTYAAADLSSLKCWYSADATFNAGSDVLLSNKTTSLGAGSQVFPTFSNQAINSGTTGYIFITTDIPLTATPSNTISVNAITTDDITFASSNKTGSANASGTKTIIDCTPTDVTSAAASSANLSSVLTWVNPACYDEILIVAALASNNGTPTGDGSAYTGNLAYGSGTALGNGFVVYKGSTSSQTVTGLTNGTQYFYKYFTRRGTSWTSGTEVNATPNIAGYYWNGASIAANPAAGGTGTWGTTNSWRQPSSSGSQATWADNNNAIFAGTAGTVTLDATRVGTAFYINTNGYIFANSTTQTLTGPIILANNVGLTLSPNVNIAVPAGGTLNIGNVSGSGTANITINSAQGSATNVAQRINLATINSSISVPINILSAGGTGTGTVAGIVATTTGTVLTSAATITNNAAIKTVIGATSGNDITANGVISGSADLMFAAGASGGAGTVTLGAANTYTGATIFNAANSGVVRLGIANALPISTNVTFGYSSGNGGSLDLNGFNQTLASIINGGFGSSVNRIVNNGNTDATLTINGSTSPTAFVFGIQDGTTNKIALVKAGSGTLILDGSTTTGGNSYTGLTTVSGGTLRLNRTGGTTIPIGNSVTVSGGTLQISSNQTLAGLTVTSGTVQIDAGVTLTIAGDVSIPSGANLILNGILTSTGTRTLTIASGANITIGNASGLSTATGTFSGGKTFTNGANYAVSVATTTPLGTAISANNFSTTQSITLNSVLSVTGTLSFENVNSKTLTTSGNLTLKSSASATGNIADLTNGGVNSGNSISGNITVERYIPAARKFRFLASPVVGGTALQWRDNGGSTPGIGTHITGSGAGFDASTSNAPSAFTYTEANGEATNTSIGGADNAGWSPFTSGTQALTNGQGYRVLVRGDRTVSLTTTPAPAANNTTLSVTGTYPTSPVVINVTRAADVAGKGWSLVGNPYPATISWNAITKSASMTGSYQTFNPSTNSYVTWNGASGDATDNISSGQGFLVFVTNGSSFTSGSITIEEADKVSGNGGSFFKTSLKNHLKVSMKYDSNNVNNTFIHFRDQANELFDPAFDAPKLTNPGVNLASKDAKGDYYSINSLPLSALNDTKVVPLSVLNSVEATYTFEFSDVNSFDGQDIYLEDKYTNKTSQLSEGQNYSFTLTSDKASSNDGRFNLIFAKKSTSLFNQTKENSFILFPNPASEQIHIGLLNTNNGSYQYEIYNQLGATIKSGNLDFNNQREQSIGVNEMSTGVYFIKVYNSNSTQTIKFIK